MCVFVNSNHSMQFAKLLSTVGHLAEEVAHMQQSKPQAAEPICPGITQSLDQASLAATNATKASQEAAHSAASAQKAVADMQKLATEAVKSVAEMKLMLAEAKKSQPSKQLLDHLEQLERQIQTEVVSSKATKATKESKAEVAKK